MSIFPLFNAILLWLLSMPRVFAEFTPDSLKSFDLINYHNDPVSSPDMSVSGVNYVTNDYIIENLMHRSFPAGSDAVIGLAAYKRFLPGFKRVVGSLRYFGYDGHIILGVHPDINQEQKDYLISNNVTFYGISVSECSESIYNTDKSFIRGKCSKDIPNLKMEWSRFEMARRWLKECEECTGYSLICDMRDIFFQADPFTSLQTLSFKSDIMFIEEISPYSSPVDDPSRSFVAGNPRNAAHVVPCYGKEAYKTYSNRPVLCSGTILGTRNGMIHMLTVLVNEFHTNNHKPNPKCKAPHTTDQWTMNWLYYNGYFHNTSLPISISTIPWGVGPVLTAGKACITSNRKTGAHDLIMQNEDGFLLNRFTSQVAPMVHQHDRCGKWVYDEVIDKYSHIYRGKPITK